jgi:hypothetical protein
LLDSRWRFRAKLFWRAVDCGIADARQLSPREDRTAAYGRKQTS